MDLQKQLAMESSSRQESEQRCALLSRVVVVILISVVSLLALRKSHETVLASEQRLTSQLSVCKAENEQLLSRVQSLRQIEDDVRAEVAKLKTYFLRVLERARC